MADGLSPSPTESFDSAGKITGFPLGRNAVVVVVEVVVVDVETARGEAPNNPEGACADIHPEHQEQKQLLRLTPFLVFYLETRAFYTPSL